MTRQAINRVLDYAETHQCQVQVTLTDGEYCADFKHDAHAKDCSTNMIAAGFTVIYNPLIAGTRYYARLM